MKARNVVHEEDLEFLRDEIKRIGCSKDVTVSSSRFPGGQMIDLEFSWGGGWCATLNRVKYLLASAKDGSGVDGLRGVLYR